jgi:DNA (cytosine-5)-methyltransferase 1
LCVGDEKGIGNQYVSQDKCIIDYQEMTSEKKEDTEIDKRLSSINLVRRLTPLECERLQGFPDGWTDIPKASDSPRYKALGNSVAVPCVDFIMHGIACFLRKIRQEEEER